MAELPPIRMPWPRRGVHRGEPRADQPQLTCDDAMNVETFDERERQGGGKRSGIDLAFDFAVGILPGPVLSMAIYRISSGLAQIDPGEQPGPGPAPEVWAGLGPGVNERVRGLVAGISSTNLIAAGDFSTAGGGAAARIAEWDGSGWSTLSGGLSSINLQSTPKLGMARANIGDGIFIYVANNANDTTGTLHVSAWDGTDWTAPGDAGNVVVNTVLAGNRGGGPRLFAGGGFTTIGGESANRVAEYDPVADAWAALGSGLGGGVTTLVIFNDGSGNKLYAGGAFTSPNRVAVFDGSTWSVVGGGIGNGTVIKLIPFQGKLYAMGTFRGIGTASLTDARQGIAAWNPVSDTWEPLAFGARGITRTNLQVTDAFVFTDEEGEALYVVGAIEGVSSEDNNAGLAVAGIARWDGEEWTAPPRGFESRNDDVLAIRAVGDAFQSQLFVGGNFGESDIIPMTRLGVWNGDNWRQLGGVAWARSGISGGNDNAYIEVALEATLGGAMESSLFCGGFDTSGGTQTFGIGTGGIENRIARYDGENWIALGSGVNNTPRAMALWDDGGGVDLYVAGVFTSPQPRIARWDGASWAGLGVGIANGSALALAVHDDGGGEALFVGGSFTTAGGGTAARIAEWDGSAWTALTDSGDNGFDAGQVNALLDTGGLLWIGGSFTSNGTKNLRRVCTWNGSAFTEPGDGFNGAVNALAVFGGSVYAAGAFTATNASSSTTVSRIARWTGSAWAALGSGLNGEGMTLYTHDDGSGAKLYVGGVFTEAGGIAAVGIAAWDGANWSKVDDTAGDGVTSMTGTAPFVRTLGTFRGEMFAGGFFLGASGGGPAYIARGEAATP